MIDDVVSFVDRMIEIFLIFVFCFRVELVCDDVCRRFYCDMVKVCFICIYSGLGMEFGIGRDGEYL